MVSNGFDVLTSQWLVSYGVDPSPIILDAKIALLLLFKSPFEIQDCMTHDEVIHL
jgi:hypothetical protein